MVELDAGEGSVRMDGLDGGLEPGAVELIVAAIVFIIGLGLLIWAFSFLSIFIRAAVSGAPVGFFDLIALSLRKVPVGMVVDSRITAVKSGLPLTIDDLSTHYLAGGSVEMVVLALIAARHATRCQHARGAVDALVLTKPTLLETLQLVGLRVLQHLAGYGRRALVAALILPGVRIE